MNWEMLYDHTYDSITEVSTHEWEKQKTINFEFGTLGVRCIEYDYPS